MRSIKESKIREIVKEAINDYVDHGEFTPIGWPSVNLKPNIRNVDDDNSENLKYVYKKLMNELNNNLKLIKNNCEFPTDLNPMFLKNAKSNRTKKQMEIAQKVIAKCTDFYSYLQNAIQEL